MSSVQTLERDHTLRCVGLAVEEGQEGICLHRMDLQGGAIMIKTGWTADAQDTNDRVKLESFLKKLVLNVWGSGVHSEFFFV